MHLSLLGPVTEDSFLLRILLFVFVLDIEWCGSPFQPPESAFGKFPLLGKREREKHSRQEEQPVQRPWGRKSMARLRN